MCEKGVKSFELNIDKKTDEFFCDCVFFNSITFCVNISDSRKFFTEIFLSLTCELNMGLCERTVNLRYIRV